MVQRFNIGYIIHYIINIILKRLSFTKFLLILYINFIIIINV